MLHPLMILLLLLKMLLNTTQQLEKREVQILSKLSHFNADLPFYLIDELFNSRLMIDLPKLTHLLLTEITHSVD